MSCQSLFLKLPREVRDEIISLVLNSPIAPPISPHHAGVRYKEDINERDDRSVFYPLPANIYGPALALSCCNRQSRQEVHDLITNPCLTKSPTYKLDVMLKGCELWPTWVTHCGSVSTIDHLQIDLRLFDLLYGGQSFWGNGGPGLAFVVLFRALNRLLHHGPTFLYHEASHGVKVNTLVINLLHGYGKVFQPSKKWLERRDDPEGDCKRFIEQDHERIYNHICSMLHIVVHQGLLSDKIQTLKVHNATDVDVISCAGIAPNNKPPQEWIEWGFIWGVDKGMKLEKGDSADLLRREEKEKEKQQERIRRIAEERKRNKR
ncbi:MAG: hypothetical protein Q9168_006534 [Polycauliona sp. 1 TL-2023]